MGWVRTTGLCLAVLIVPLATMGASAQAAPGSLEFGKCAAHAGGKFKSASCTKLAKSAEEQKFEWTPLSTAVAITGAKAKETGNAVLETASGIEISCPGETEAGEYGPASKEERNIVLRFTGCRALGCDAHSAGAKEGEVVWNKLRGVPGIIKPEAKEEKGTVGIAFSPQSAGNDAEFECAGVPLVVRGGVIASWISNGRNAVNKMLSRVGLGFATEKPGKQVPEGFAGEPKLTLEFSAGGGAFEQAAVQLSAIQETSPKTTKIELRHCEQNVC